jgi:hypothetical protein
MDKLFLLISVVLLVLAIKAHAITQIHVKQKIERAWFERLFTGSRPDADNLTEEGLKYRRKSNLYAIAGFACLGVYVYMNASA